MTQRIYDYETIARQREGGLSWDELADLHGAPSSGSLRSGFYRYRDKQGHPPDWGQPEQPEVDPVDNVASATVGAGDVARIHTLDQLLDFFKVDTNAWDVERFLVNKWESGAIDRESGEWTVTPLYQVKANLVRSARRSAAILAQLRDDYLADIKEHAPVYTRVERPRSFGDGDPALFELAIMDPHFGLQAFGAELTGIDQDLKTVADDFALASEKLLSLARLYNTERILVLLGNDGLHVDAPFADGRVGGQTTRGTPQDVDTRLGKMFTAYRRALVQQIDRARLIAPVDVVLVAGNHARIAEYHMAETLAAWYRDDPEVSVRVDEGIRQFYSYGANTFMLTHGEETKRQRDNLAMVMADECPPELWVSSDHRQGGLREIHTGHVHAKQRGGWFPTGELTESRGIRLRGLSGLTATDAWHHERGYRHTRAATALAYRRSGGCMGEHEFQL